MKCLTFLLCLGLSQAAPLNLIVNGGFENGDFDASTPHGNQPGLAVGSTAVTGWTVYQAGAGNADPVSWLQLPFDGLQPDSGNRWLDLTGYQDTMGSYGGVEQAITTVPDMVYFLSFAVGVCSGVGECGAGMSLPGPVQVIASAGTTSTTVVHDPVGTGNLWDVYSMKFIADSASTTVRIQGTGMTPASRMYVALDDVAVSPAPEPEALVLMGIGLTLILLGVRRRQG